MSQGTPIHTIATHIGLPWDKATAIYLAKKFGEQQFPGISKADVVFWSAGATPDGRTAEEYEAEGILLIGTGYGRFDEHPAPDRERRAGQSSTSLVAQALGIAERPEIMPLVKYATSEELKGDPDRYKLGFAAKLIRRLRLGDAELLEWITVALDALCEQDRRFHCEAPQVIEEHGQHALFHHQGRKLRVLSIETDHDQVKAYATSKPGGGTAIVIQRQSTGHTQVFLNRYYKLNPNDIVRGIRHAELAAAGLKPDPAVNYLAEGATADTPEWYYFKAAQNMLNGSPAAPNAPATRLSLEQITTIVVEAVTPTPPSNKVPSQRRPGS